MRSRYLVKIIPRVGYRIYRVQFSRRHIVAIVLFAVLAAGAGSWLYVSRIGGAEARAAQLRALSVDQHDKLERIDAQAGDLDAQLRTLEEQNASLRRMIGADPQKHGSLPQRPKASRSQGAPLVGLTTGDSLDEHDDFAVVERRIATLRAHSAVVRAEGDRLRGLTLHVLNMDRLAEISRAAVLANIPSVSPTGHLDVASTFGWRLSPWPEFHQGLDLVADYGDPVRSAAAGTIVFASFDDGGYGNRIEIDHGNGYHTWYCHLSQIDVKVGDYVRKAQHIGEIGSTGESTGPHLHYQMMLDGKAIDPQPYITGVPARVLAGLK